jgi:transposase, IS30 family
VSGWGHPRVARERQRQFWREVRRGLSCAEAARAVGVSVRTGQGWFAEGGGMPIMSLAEPSGRFLSFAEREEIAAGLCEGLTAGAIARALGRSPSTICREIGRNKARRPGWSYRAGAAQSRADQCARRPKTAKLAANSQLRQRVEDGLAQRWSPQQIATRLRIEFPQDPEMQVSHETIYQSLYVQGRGALRRELTVCLRAGRAIRKPRPHAERRRARIANMVMISDRPAEAADRAVPGHWEGDLILGKNNRSAIGTLVERKTRYTLLLHLPNGHSAEAVQQAMLTTICTLPRHLWRSLTWDQGTEMAAHREITFATDLPIYFCDPASPWQRGTNENTNGLLRQYFRKGTDLSIYGPDELARVAVELNGRPRKTLGWRTPAEALNDVLSSPYTGNGVAMTP